MNISQLLKFIADLNPQNTPARLAFYNFLRHFQFFRDELNPQILNAFFSYALDYPHWESNKVSLGKEVQLLMESYVRFSKKQFDFNQVHFPQSIQVVEIQSQSDLIDVTHTYARHTLLPEERFRIIPDQGRRVLLVILKEDHSVDVYTFDKKFVIRNGLLEPLRTDLKLSYNSRLELKENVIHRIEVAPYLMAQFTMHQGRPQGCLLRGYVFQKYQELKNHLLEEQTKVFYPLKKLEQLYIDRQSDPFYLDLIGHLSEVIQHFQYSEKETFPDKMAKKALERAELALKEVFLDDKTLAGLIKDLQQLMLKAANASDSSTGASNTVLQASKSRDPELWPKHLPVQDSIN